MSILAKLILPSLCLTVCALGQQVGSGAAQPPKVSTPTAAASQPVPSGYALHSEDEITVRSLQVKEIGEKAFRLDSNGDVNFPLIGRVHLGGDSVQTAEHDLIEKLKTFYREPDLAVTVTAFHDEPVSIIGAVATPGVHNIHGQTTLVDVLSSAGGVRGDAGPVVKVTRDSSVYGPIPYPTAHSMGTRTSVVEIDLKSLLNAQNAAENIVIEPHDVIAVPPAEVIYIVGNVKRAGSFPLAGKPELTVLQAVSLAEGLDPRAAPTAARILRRESDTNPTAKRTDIPVNIAAILKGKSPDVLMRPNDILYVPSSVSKVVTQRSIEVAISVATGILVFGKH